MKRRLLTGLLAGLLVALLTLAALGGWLTNSENGLRWTLRQASTLLPGELRIGQLAGSMNDFIVLRDVEFVDGTISLSADRIVLRWHPWSLWSGELDIASLVIEQLAVELHASSTANSDDLHLPQVNLPLDLRLDSLLIDRAQLTRGAQVLRLDRGTLVATLEGSQLHLGKLDLEATDPFAQTPYPDDFRLKLTGDIDLRKRYAHRIAFDWQTRLASGELLQNSTQIAGDLDSTQLTQQTQGPLQAKVSLQLSTPLEDLHWQGEADITEFDSTKLDEQLPIVSGQLQLTGQGDGQSARLEGRLIANSADIGPFDASFRLRNLEPPRRIDGLQVDALEIAIYDGKLQAHGQVYWSPHLQWSAQLNARDIDPQTLLAEWPGRVNADLASQGQIDDDGLELRAEISDANGHLRDYPFSLNGKLHWIDDGLEIETAALKSGNTRIDAKGRVGQAFDLDWSLRSEDLVEIHPAAGGQLNAEGHVGGEVSTPVIEARITGRSLQFEDFRAASIDGDLAIDLQNWQQLDIHLDARELELAGQPLQSLTVNGNQRRLDARLTSADFNADLSLVGEVVDDAWRGRLVNANIDSSEFDNWRLQSPSAVHFSANSISLATTCLQSSRAAKACGELNKSDAQTDIGLDLAGVPVGLLRRWLPSELVADGKLDATGQFTYHPDKALLGKLDASLAAASASYPLQNGVREQFDFDRVELALLLGAQQVTASTRLQLQNGDRLDASLLLPDADLLRLDQRQQTLQAKLRIDARDWGVVDRQLAQVNALRGHLQADLFIDGTLAQPQLKGEARLDQGAFELPSESLSFERISAIFDSDGKSEAHLSIDAHSAGGDVALRATSSHALRIDPRCLAASGDPQTCTNLLQPGERWKLDLALAAIPLQLLEHWTTENLQLDGVIDAHADFEYHNSGHLSGQLDATLPAANASFPLDAERVEQLAYREGRLQLQLDQQQLTADSRLVLQNGDQLGVTANLPGVNPFSLDLRNQPLQASIRVDARDWSMVDAMLPQVDNLQGRLQLDLAVSGNLDDPRFEGSASIDRGSIDLLESRLRLEQLKLRAQSDGPERVRYNIDAATSGGNIVVRGDTLLDREQGWASNLELDGDNLDIAALIAQWVEQPLRVNGRMRTRASLRYRAPDLLHGNVQLSSTSGNLSYPLLKDERENWSYQDATLQFELSENGIRGNSSLMIENDNEFTAAIELPRARLLALDSENQDLSGSAKVRFDELELVQYLVPEIDQMRGELRLDLELAGKLASPLLVANATMRQGSFTIPRLGLQISEINLQGSSDAQDRFNFELTGKSGEGHLLINGSSLLDPARGWPATIRITGEEFEVSRIPEAQVRVSPDLTIAVEARDILIEGDVLIPYARLQPRDISTAAQVSRDTVVIGSEKPAEERWLVTTRVNLLLGDRVTFFGFGFEGKFGGRLLIEDAPGQLSVGTGEINIPEGRYRAYGQRLDIENGRLLFTGSPLDNPGLDIRAIRRANDIVVGIQLRGRARQPELELFSIPAMGQTDTLSYLILGRPMEGASETEGEMVAKAALALGLAGGDTLARRIGDEFGIDEIRVESSDDGDQASLVVGRYLSPKLYVSYGVGLIESINSLNLRYQLSERWKVEAESGEEHGADLLFTIER